MYSQLLTVAGLAALATAQNMTMDNSTMQEGSLTALLSDTEELSTLTETIMGVDGLAEMLGSAQNITILAPSNEAFEAFMETPMAQALMGEDGQMDSEAVQALLMYHVLNGTYASDTVTETPTFIPTMLNNTDYANVTGGQVVSAVTQEDNVLIYSGLSNNATVTTPDNEFDGGVVHIIDTVLTIPRPISDTANAANLSSLVGALTRSQLAGPLDSMMDVTVFAPNNSAFRAIGSAVGNLTNEQLAEILSYHVVNGTVGYSSDLMDGMTLTTLGGGELTISIEEGDVFVNSALVQRSDILVANGVVHVIDNVLNPNNSMAEPDPTATSQMPAFTGATEDDEDPLTSGVPTPTEMVGTGPTPAEDAGSEDSAEGEDEEGAAPRITGAIGAAALFAGAGVWLNA
ncbi:MAG: hypothetical protein Q9183_005639 [Haloplaca sp. 2 TL-2023]